MYNSERSHCVDKILSHFQECIKLVRKIVERYKTVGPLASAVFVKKKKKSIMELDMDRSRTRRECGYRGHGINVKWNYCQ